MHIGFSREQREFAKVALANAPYNPRVLALIYTGVSVGIAFLFTAISYLIQQQIDTTGGLGGMGMRAILSTLQSVLPMISAIFVPFWDAGYVKASILHARHETATPQTLLTGLRRFGPVLRLLLLRMVCLFIIMFVSAQASSILFSMTPWAAPVQEMSETILAAGAITDELIAQMLPTLLPLYGLFFLIFLGISIPFFYCLRMADYALMDKPVGALGAMILSFRMMRGNLLRLLKLDLSFWWFYVIGICSVVIGYLDMILPYLGINLPISADAAFFLFYILHILCELILAWCAVSYVKTTYACAYDTFLPQEQNPTIIDV